MEEALRGLKLKIGRKFKVGIVGVIVSCAIAAYFENIERHVDEDKLQAYVDRSTDAIEQRLVAVEFVANALSAFIAATPLLTADEFSAYARAMFVNVGLEPSIEGFGWLEVRDGKLENSYAILRAGTRIPLHLERLTIENLKAHVGENPIVGHPLIWPNSPIEPRNGVDDNSSITIIETIAWTGDSSEGGKSLSALFITVDPEILVSAASPTGVRELASVAGLSWMPVGGSDQIPILGGNEWLRESKIAYSRSEGMVRTAFIAGEPIVFFFEPTASTTPLTQRQWFYILVFGLLGTALLVRYVSIVQQQNRMLKDARRTAEQANSQKSRFLANMSHEIRTPLSGVIGMAKLLARSKLDERQREISKNLVGSSETLLAIINDILDYVKLESEQLRLDPQPTDVAALTRSAGGQFSALAREKSLQLRLQYSPDAPRHLVVDGLRLRQIISNLVGNALKFTSEGKVVIGVWHEEIEGVSDKVLMCFNVRDTGIGIPEDVQKLIFQRFIQADASTTKRFGGTGLGLSICQQLVQQMGGDIAVESTPGAGSRFKFRLPLEVTTADAIRDLNEEVAANDAAAAVVVEAPRKAAVRLSVLLVEDDAVNQFYAQEILATLACDVDTANNGEIAVDAVQQKAYDLILMDCQMPVMDGFTASREIVRLRAKGEASTAPIIALTANALKGDRERCLEAGMRGYLAKPLNDKDLEKILTRIRRNKLATGGAKESPEASPPVRTPAKAAPSAAAAPALAKTPARRPAKAAPPAATAPAPAKPPARTPAKAAPSAAAAPASAKPPARTPAKAAPPAAAAPKPAKTPDPTPSSAPDDDLIDWDIWSRTAENMGPKLSKILEMYLADTEDYISQVRQHIDAEDMPSCALPAHTVKSSSRLFGLMALADIAADLEAAGKAPGAMSLDDAAKRTSDLEKTFEATKVIVSAKLAEAA